MAKAKKKVEKVVDPAVSIRKAQDDSRSQVIKKSAAAHLKSLKG